MITNQQSRNEDDQKRRRFKKIETKLELFSLNVSTHRDDLMCVIFK